MIPPEPYWSAIREALRLYEPGFNILNGTEDGSQIAFITVILAGLASTFGQSVVLFINRVKPRRFLFSVSVSVLLFSISYSVWATVIWLLGRTLFHSEATLLPVARAVGLGYAPLLFSFLVFMPYLGTPTGRLLSLWSLLAITIGSKVALELSLWQALICTVLGWVLLQGLQRTIGYPLVKLAGYLKAQVAGVPEVKQSLELEDLLDEASRAGLMTGLADATVASTPQDPLLLTLEQRLARKKLR